MQYIPRTDGETVVWANPAHNEIFAARLPDGRAFPVVTFRRSGGGFDVSGDLVVWEEMEPAAPCGPIPPGTITLNCPGDIRGKNLATGEDLTIAATAANEWGVSISGPWIVWMSSEVVSLTDKVTADPTSIKKALVTTLMARDLRTHAEPISLYQSRNRLGGPVIDGDRVLWAEEIPGESGRAHVRLLMQQIGSPSFSVLVEEEEKGYLLEYDFGGDLVVYRIGYTQDIIRIVNIRTGWTRTITNAIGPTTDRRYVFWVEPWPLDSMSRARNDLWGYDTVADVTAPIMVDMGSNVNPEIRSGVLVWWRNYIRDDGQAEADVYVAYADALFKSRASPQPVP